MVDSSPDAPRINEPAVWVVIREQQRPEPRACTLGISPADNHELPSVLAFDLHPEAAIAGRIGCLRALGDNALERQFAGLGIELRALSDLVIAVLQRRADI